MEVDWIDAADDHLPKRTEEAGPNGTLLITEYKMKGDKMLKVAKKVLRKTIRVRESREAEQRQKSWTFFGSLNAEGTCNLDSNEAHIVSVDQVEDDPLQKLVGKQLLTCKKCGGNHLTLSCTNDKSFLEMKMKTEDAQQKSTKYVARIPTQDAFAMMEEPTVRIDNLPLDITETEIRAIVSSFTYNSPNKNIPAKVRTPTMTDRITGQRMGKGYAFVVFNSKEEADVAVRGLNNYKHGYRVLKAEMSMSVANMNSTFRSGYGKALVQSAKAP